jgi:tetratricopeptide (TPR) repeat protein
MQLAEGNTAEAETALQNAIKLDPTDPDVRVAFVSFLVGQDRTPEAEAAVQQARKQVAAKWRPLMLAKCYELVGKLELAEREYQTVLGADPRRSDVSWRLVRFYLRGGRLDDARALLETLIDPQNKTPIRILLQARRALSTLLVLNGPYSAYKRATTLIEANLKTEPGNTQDLLAQAKLLQTRPNRRLRRQAILILEDLNERSVLSDRDKFDLARLYVAVGKWPQARLWLMSLISTKSKNAQWLACGVRNSIAHGELTGICEIWLEQLERLQPESLRTLELRAQYLVAHRRIDDGLKLIDQWLHRADGDEPPPGRLRTVAMLLSSFADTLDRTGQTAESARLSAVAEQHFRRLVEREPNAIPAMIRFFQRRDRIDEALSWCERAWQHASPEEVAAACVALLSTGRMSEEQVGSLLLSIEKSRREHPDLRRLLIHHANAALLARRYSQAEDLYREVIREFPNAYLAYNDLALLVIFRRGNSAEALPLVEKAIEIVGPLPFLLDSRATVYLSMQDADSAAQDLQQAIEDDPTPEKYFHLTQAQLALKNAPAAKSAYEKAVEANLHVGALHPLEAPAYAEVSAAIMRIKSSVKNQR